MLNKNGERELAYVVKVDDIRPIDGADKVELAVVGGWTVMVRKGQFVPGSLAVYFEIDSRVPEEEKFKFLEPKHYAIKTQKYFKGTVISQGLLMSAEDFGWETGADNIGSHKLGDGLTEELKVKYIEADDNSRKAPSVDKYKKMASRHPKIFRNRIVRKLYKTAFGKRLLFAVFGNSSDKKVKNWPSWVVKTDEERVQNMPWILTDKEPWIATEKIDGTSTTFTMRRGKKKLFGKVKNDFYMCSRNVVFDTSEKMDKGCWYDTNVYVEMAQRYDLENVMNSILKSFPEYDWVTIQGETFGNGIQKRDYGMKGHDFKAFNFITSKDGRWNSRKAADFLYQYGINWVPIVDDNFILPDTVEELLHIATGKSVVDGGMREGLVFRSQDGTKSFKAVSNEYLMKYHG